MKAKALSKENADSIFNASLNLYENKFNRYLIVLIQKKIDIWLYIYDKLIKIYINLHADI